jgi:hypothetical protein
MLDYFGPPPKSVFGVQFATKTMEIGGKIVKVQTWDTTGEERSRAVTCAYFRNVVGAMLVYNITRPLPRWVDELLENAHPTVVVIMFVIQSHLTSPQCCPPGRSISQRTPQTLSGSGDDAQESSKSRASRSSCSG